MAILVAWAVAARRLAPASNTPLNRFDVIIVLGYPADNDGNPTPIQLARVTEAAHEYERGIAARLIATGAAVSNHFVEAQVMAKTAEAQGVPASAWCARASNRMLGHDSECVLCNADDESAWVALGRSDFQPESPAPAPRLS